MPYGSDSLVRDILESTQTIAMVGASDNKDRASNGVLKFLLEKGYTVYPVNPKLAGKTIHGRTVYEKIGDIEGDIDMVDIFRRSEDAGRHVDEAIETGAKAVWMQLGVEDKKAARRAGDRGLKVVMDRCPAQDIPRLNIHTPE